MLAEYTAYHLDNYRNRADEIGDQARETIEAGLVVTAVDYVNAHRERTLLNREFAKIWDQFDVLVGPTERITAPTIEDASPPASRGSESRHPSLSSLAGPFNTTGSPAVTVPCGFTGAGMPVGLQIVGKAFDDAAVLRVAKAYQDVTNWHGVKPEC